MRVNVYAEEMTDRVEIISKEIDGISFTGLRLYLELPVTVGHDDDGNPINKAGPFEHRKDDDDSAAVTFWGKRDLRSVLYKMLAQLNAHYGDGGPTNFVISEIAAERRRQVEEEGWSAEHDDDWLCHELAEAAACYALHVNDGNGIYRAGNPPPGWPFGETWWKPKNPRRDLIRAGALIVAEIERMDREAAAEERQP